MFHTRSRVIASAVAVIAAIAMVAAAMSGYGASKTVTGNIYATGAFSMSTDKSTAIYNLTNAKPGDVAGGSLTVTNTGSLSGDFSITAGAEASSDATLDAAMTYTVYAGSTPTGTPLASGPLTGFGTLDLGNIAGSGSKTIYIAVTLPDQGQAADNALLGKTSDWDFTVSGVQN